MGKSQNLYKKAKEIIPGGTQLLSKRPEMFLPEYWPAYYKHAKGCAVWDLDNKKYLDMYSMGIGCCALGYADKDVDNAVVSAIKAGSMSSLNCPEEVELAELLCELHPWAQMVRFVRCGGEAMAVAVRIARAASKRDKILFCGYHGWHDWYLSANLAEKHALDGQLLPGLEPLGVPRGLTGFTIPFKFNDVANFKQLLAQYYKKVGVIVLEPERNYYPTKDFIEAIHDACREYHLILVVDEITSGWRINLGGIHLRLGIKPDIAVFAKAISNGFPMGAIIGRKEVMKAAQETFISSTYWTEKIGPVAALATIKKMKKYNVQKHLMVVGETVREGWRQAAGKHGLPLEITGIDPLLHFSFQHEKPLVLRTLFTQLMLKKGFLASNAFYASYAHHQNQIKRYLRAVNQAFEFIGRAVKNDNPEKYLKGPVCHAGFKRLN